MGALFILLGCSIIIAIAFLIAFIWSVSNGQYDDDYTPSIRILLDNEPVNNTKKEHQSNEKLAKNGNGEILL